MEHIIERAKFVTNHLAGVYGYHASPECAPQGSGQCDGFDYDSSETETCQCPCHTGEDPLFERCTLGGMHDAHIAMWNWGA